MIFTRGSWSTLPNCLLKALYQFIPSLPGSAHPHVNYWIKIREKPLLILWLKNSIIIIIGNYLIFWEVKYFFNVYQMLNLMLTIFQFLVLPQRDFNPSFVFLFYWENQTFHIYYKYFFQLLPLPGQKQKEMCCWNRGKGEALNKKVWWQFVMLQKRSSEIRLLHSIHLS